MRCVTVVADVWTVADGEHFLLEACVGEMCHCCS